MTLYDIINQSLVSLGFSTDAQSMAAWKEKLSYYVNDGIEDIAKELHLRRTDKNISVSEDGTFKIEDLSHQCLKVVSVKQEDTEVSFEQSMTSDEIKVDAEGNVDVEYRYVPPRIKNDIDKPGIPEYLHSLLVPYVVYRQHITLDPTIQRRSDYFWQIYDRGLRQARKDYGEEDTFKIRNTGW